MPFLRPMPERKPDHDNRGLLSAYIEAERYLQIALMLPAAALIGWGIGAWIDWKLQLHWLGAVGVVVGCLAGVVNVIRMAMAYVRAPQPGDAKTDAKPKGQNDSEDTKNA